MIIILKLHKYNYQPRITPLYLYRPAYSKIRLFCLVILDPHKLRAPQWNYRLHVICYFEYTV